ncbi:hypothetical protein [Streptosporangium sp. NPDC000396]|uniref:hypothetical protein n=1 Tax=Streptosporangium sp. NPDC000396 TaxID=3366185 RepID=UPI0036914978
MTYRTLYYEAAFDDPIAAPVMVREIAAGEQARILTDPPIKFLIRDDDLLPWTTVTVRSSL